MRRRRDAGQRLHIACRFIEREGKRDREPEHSACEDDLFLSSVALLFEREAPLRWSGSAVASLAYLSVLGTAVAFVALFWLVPRVPVAVIGSIPLVDTLIAVLLGAIVLGETLSARILVGGAMIVGGVLLATRAAPARKSQDPSPKSL